MQDRPRLCAASDDPELNHFLNAIYPLKFDTSGAEPLP